MNTFHKTWTIFGNLITALFIVKHNYSANNTYVTRPGKTGLIVTITEIFCLNVKAAIM